MQKELIMLAKTPFFPDKPILIVCGHFGSGKTCVSVALALALKKSGKNVTLVDLDIVNPYFRAADAAELMKANGINCINPEFANILLRDYAETVCCGRVVGKLKRK